MAERDGYIEGVPCWALMSVRLIAFGLPPDSVCIW